MFGLINTGVDAGRFVGCHGRRVVAGGELALDHQPVVARHGGGQGADAPGERAAGVKKFGIVARAALAVRALDALATAIDTPPDLEPVERLRRACRPISRNTH